MLSNYKRVVRIEYHVVRAPLGQSGLVYHLVFSPPVTDDSPSVQGSMTRISSVHSPSWASTLRHLSPSSQGHRCL